MFAINSAWVNASAKPIVEVGVILSQSPRQRGVVILRGEVPPIRTLSRNNAIRSGLGLPPAPQEQLPVTPAPQDQLPVTHVVRSPAPSPPHSDDEDDDWRYEC